MAAAADADDRVLVTKDGDFRDSHRLRGVPRRLLIVTTGNIANDELLQLFASNLELLVSALGTAGMALPPTPKECGKSPTPTTGLLASPILESDDRDALESSESVDEGVGRCGEERLEVVGGRPQECRHGVGAA